MCRSVPQMAVFSSLISTSLGPGVGTGTCSSQMPLFASRLTSAFIVCAIWRNLLSESKPAIIGVAACMPCGGAGMDVMPPWIHGGPGPIRPMPVETKLAPQRRIESRRPGLSLPARASALAKHRRRASSAPASLQCPCSALRPHLRCGDAGFHAWRQPGLLGPAGGRSRQRGQSSQKNTAQPPCGRAHHSESACATRTFRL